MIFECFTAVFFHFYFLFNVVHISGAVRTQEFKCYRNPDIWKQTVCEEKYRRLKYAGEPCHMTHYGMSCCNYCKDKLDKKPTFLCEDMAKQCQKHKGAQMNQRNLYFLTVYCFNTFWCNGDPPTPSWWTTDSHSKQSTTPLLAHQPTRTSTMPPSTPTPTSTVHSSPSIPTSTSTSTSTSISTSTAKEDIPSPPLWLSPEKVIEESVQRALKALIDRQRIRVAKESEERKIREEDEQKKKKKKKMEEMEAKIPPHIKKEILEKFNPGAWWPFTG